MSQMESRAAYLSASADGATQIGLHVVVYNFLAGDLLLAGEACRKRDISGRCSASSRALLLLGHLETWASYFDDRQLIESLLAFYRDMRQKIVCLQAKGSPADFEQLSETIQGVRGAWQAKERVLIQSNTPVQTHVQHLQVHGLEPHDGRTTSAWCA